MTRCKMTNPLTSATYCAVERLTYEKIFKYKIDYMVFFDSSTFITHTIKVRGSLNSIDKITKEDKTRGLNGTVEDFFKEKDYNVISQALIDMGNEVKAIGHGTKKHYHFTNGGRYAKLHQARELKPFEEEIFLKAYHHKL